MAATGFLGLVLALSVLGAVQTYPSSDKSIGSLHIIGGEKADIADFKYQVSVRKRGHPYAQSHVCGGSVIDASHVLTAAHCIAKPQMPSLYYVMAGATSLSGGIVRKVKTVMIHENYKNSNPFQFDLALLRLEEPFIFGSGQNIEAVPLVTLGEDTAAKTSVVVAGWGRTILGNTNPELDFSEDLLKLEMEIVDRAECDKDFGGTHKITNRVICAGVRGVTEKRDASLGDSGGPLVDRQSGVQLGIVSFGDESSSAMRPGVYTNLANSEVRGFLDKALKG